MDQHTARGHAKRLGVAARDAGIDLTDVEDPSLAELMHRCSVAGVSAVELVEAASK